MKALFDAKHPQTALFVLLIVLMLFCAWVSIDGQRFTVPDNLELIVTILGAIPMVLFAIMLGAVKLAIVVFQFAGAIIQDLFR